MKTLTEPQTFGLRKGAEEFPLMVVVAVIYPCNFGCPNCPYTDGNSELRSFYREHNGELFPREMWDKLADEAGPYGAWLRCTGGGEPMLHPQMTEMIEYAKARGARVWMNTNGSMFGPTARLRDKLKRILTAGIDLIEFSMDAADAETYAELRPPRKGRPRDPQKWFNDHVNNIRAALELRKELGAETRIVVSMIRQKAVEDKLDEAIRFWREEIGVDEVITRKFLTWDDNTDISFAPALDAHLYADLPTERKQPCVWPFERLNIDPLGRISLCGQDISFRTADLFPNFKDQSLREIWLGERFNWYRKMHLDGRGAECWPCRGCSAWLAGVRDWEYGWLRVLKNADANRQHAEALPTTTTDVLQRDLGAEVEIHGAGSV